MTTPRFEIVRTNGRGYDQSQPWHGRFIAANGRIVWSTEPYDRRRSVLRAIELVTGYTPFDVQGTWFISTRHGTVEVSDVDERTP